MLKEIISYDSNIPVKISMVSIDEYPIHYHENDLEFFVVLEGEIKLIEGYRTLLLKKGDVFIVNELELHGIYSTEIKNKLLIVQINLTHFQRFNHEFSNFFLMADSYEGGKKVNALEHELKQQLFKVAESFLLKEEHSDTYLTNLIKDLLAYLIDNFKYFAVWEGNYFVINIAQKNNDVQASRVHDIYDYIMAHYTENITLKEYAHLNHLNMYHLSHIIKDTTGLSFQEILNFTRVEASETYLLETNMKIGEIALIVGFSAKRYYEKCFQLWYKTSPEEYRQSNKKRVDAPISQQAYTVEDILSVIDSDGDYITFAGKTNESYVKVVKADLNKRAISNSTNNHLIVLNGMNRFNGKAYEDDVTLLKQHMSSFGKPAIDITNLSEQKLFGLVESLQERVQDFILDNSGVDDSLKQWELVNKLIYYYKHHYRVSSLPITIHLSKEEQIPDSFNPDDVVFKNIKFGNKLFGERNHVYDSVCYVPFMLNEMSKKKNSMIFNMVDEERRSTKPLRGDSGIITWNGLPKPSFYGQYMYSLLGTDLLHADQNLIVTGSDDNIQILLYDYSMENFKLLKDVDDIDDLISIINNDKLIEVALEIGSIWGNYKQTTIALTNHNCLLNKWADMGMKKLLSYTDELLLRKSLFPKVDFHTIDINGRLDLKTDIPGFGAKLILLEKET